MNLRIGSLFSGVGGLELGLEWGGVGHVVWQVESGYVEGDTPAETEKLTARNKAFLWHVLSEHWPEAKRYEDVRTVGRANLAPVDLICGGFPCQDISVAGKGAGLAGARSGLWSEFARIVGELRPRYVVVENVAALLARGMGAVLGDLSALGYDASWTTLRASDSGAPHRRERIFIVAWLADADLGGDTRGPADGGANLGDPDGARREGRWPDAHQGGPGSGDGCPELADPDGDGREGAEFGTDGPEEGNTAERGRGGPVADPDGERLQERRPSLAAPAQEPPAQLPGALADADRGRREGLGLAESRGIGGASGDVADRRGVPRGGHEAEASRVAYAPGARRAEPTGPRHLDGGRTDAPDGGAPAGAAGAAGAGVADADGLGLGPGIGQLPARQPDALGSALPDPERDAVRHEPERDQRQGGQVREAERGIVGGGAHGLPDRVDRWPSGPGSAQGDWEPRRASPAPETKYGRAIRRLRLRGLGNAVVPEVVCDYVAPEIHRLEHLRRRRAA